MKKVVFIIVLYVVTFNINAQENIKYLDLNAVLVPNETVYLFGNNVKFRENSNVNAKVLDQLKIGTELKIIERTAENHLYNGISWPWYKVKYKGKEGFIIGGLISLDKKEINNSVYLISLKKNNDDYHILTRVVDKKAEEYFENISRFETESLFSLDVFDNQGLENITNMVYINYHAEACGVNGGGYYLFNDGNSLKKAINITSVGDGGIYWFDEEVIFPNDKNGKKGKILYKRERGEVVDENNNQTKIVIHTCEFIWKGELLKLKEIEE